ncbi:hypothetical protein KY343_06595 [Candidatus Woesearchaeota archaeon]|nr:hypothetical protein [Candidatus Woesearchaeota archaeon]
MSPKKEENSLVLAVMALVLIILIAGLFSYFKTKPIITGLAVSGYGELPGINGDQRAGAPLGGDIPTARGGCVPFWEKVVEPCFLKQISETESIWIESEFYRHTGWNLENCFPEQLPDRIITEYPCTPDLKIYVETEKPEYFTGETVYLNGKTEEISVCGNNVCDEGENIENCPEDCR